MLQKSPHDQTSLKQPLGNDISERSEHLQARVTNLKSTRVWILTRIIRRFPEERAALARDIIRVPKEKLDKSSFLIECRYVLLFELGNKGPFSSHSKLVEPRRDTPLDLGQW